MVHSLLFSTLSEEELNALPPLLLDTVAQVVGGSEIHLYPNLQTALEAAFATHRHTEGITQHIIITQDPDKAMVTEYLKILPERTWVYLIINRLEAHEADWWLQQVSHEFGIIMIDSGGTLSNN